jgi:Ca2+-binding RTX toxin-like protein
MRWTRMLFIPTVAVFALGPVSSIPTYAGTAGCTIVGTNGHDVIHGTGGADVICGRGGADELHGAGGNDVLRGGRGDDSLYGNVGNDLLVGGPVVTSCPTVEATTS